MHRSWTIRADILTPLRRVLHAGKRAPAGQIRHFGSAGFPRPRRLFRCSRSASCAFRTRGVFAAAEREAELRLDAARLPCADKADLETAPRPSLRNARNDALARLALDRLLAARLRPVLVRLWPHVALPVYGEVPEPNPPAPAPAPENPDPDPEPPLPTPEHPPLTDPEPPPSPIGDPTSTPPVPQALWIRLGIARALRDGLVRGGNGHYETDVLGGMRTGCTGNRIGHLGSSVLRPGGQNRQRYERHYKE